MLANLTTHTRILLLVVASALPSILLATYVTFQHRTASIQRTVEELRCRAALIEALLPAFGPDALRQDAGGRGQTATLIDRTGIVVAQHPPLLGEVANPFTDRDVLEGPSRREVVSELHDSHGIRHLYAARKTRSGHTIVISMPDAVALDHADRLLVHTFVGIAGATGALLLITWVGANRLVIAPIRRMLEVTRRVQNGDLTARTGMRAGQEELSQLGASLDAMAEQLAEHERAVQAELVEETRRALTDPLTSLYNRRFLLDAIQRQIAVFRRTGEPFSIILFDLDHFKVVNDRFGHDAGDLVLAQTARVLLRAIRASDFGVRYGGEEFAVLLLQTDLPVAAVRAEEIRSALEAHETVHGQNPIRITASFGVAQFEPAEDADALLKAVDGAMYAAKAAGRNRVMLAARNQPMARDSRLPAQPRR